MFKNLNLDKTFQYLLIILAFLMPLTVFGANLIIVIICALWLFSGNYKSKFEQIINNNTRQSNKIGPKQYLEDLKFLLPNPNSNFANYTISEAINRTIDINATAEITVSDI